MSDSSQITALDMSVARRNNKWLKNFKEYSVAHQTLKQADVSLWNRVLEPGGANMIFVYGPTGVGKTTLRQHITRRLKEEIKKDPEHKEHEISVLSLEAAAPETGNFGWRHFFRQALGELEAPFLKDKVEYAARAAYFDNAGNYVIRSNVKVSDLRLAVEQSLRYRKPRAVFIDEAQHMAKIYSSRRLQEQMDVLKSLSNVTDSLLVLIGTYELLTFQGLSGQLSRRSVGIHFPRYGSSEEEMKAFQSVLHSFQGRLPVKKEPNLLAHTEYCYVRSIGCVGILKDWLVRALVRALDEGGDELTIKHLEETALSVWQCERIARETSYGEERLTERPGSESRLKEMLGFVINQMSGVYSEEEAVEEKKPEDGRVKAWQPKRRVGERKPKRDLLMTNLDPTLMDPDLSGMKEIENNP